MQRSRLLGAAVSAVDELGWSQAAITQIAARARVSRRTFYELFSDREDCLLAVIDDAVEQVAGELAAAGVADLPWRERMRTGMWTILCFFDREPVLARVCVVQSVRGSRRVLERREELLALLGACIGQGGHEGTRARECPPLVAEGLVGAAVSIVNSRLLRVERREPLGELLGELMAMIVLPYLGPGVARRERSRPAPMIPVGQSRFSAAGSQFVRDDPLASIPMRLTYRTARVLEGVAELGGRGSGPSNRLVADYADISDQGQVSKLLARLQGLGLLQNTGEGHARGERNAWCLTPLGLKVTQQLSLNTHSQDERAAR